MRIKWHLKAVLVKVELEFITSHWCFSCCLADVSCSAVTQKYNDQSIINPAQILFFTQVETDQINHLREILTSQWTRFQTSGFGAPSKHVQTVCSICIQNIFTSCPVTLWIFGLLFLHASVAVWCSGKHVSLRKPNIPFLLVRSLQRYLKKKILKFSSVQLYLYNTKSQKQGALYCKGRTPQ